MQVLQLAGEFTMRMQEWAFVLSLVVSGLFWHEYRRLEAEEKNRELLDNFLEDS